MATYSDLTTAANVKTRLGQTGSDFDTLLGNLVTEVSQDLQKRMGRAVLQETHTEYHDGSGTDRLRLLQGPLVSVTSVEVITYEDDGAGGRQESAETLDAYNYLLENIRSEGGDAPGVLVYNGGRWSPGRRNYKVVYVAGWETDRTTIQSLESDAITAVASLFYSREAAGMRDKPTGDLSASFWTPAQLDAALERVAAKWRFDPGLS